MPIHLSELQQMAVSAYPGKTKLQIGAFKLFYSTPSLKFYSDGTTVVVAVRGTYDARDFAAWSLVATGTLNTSSRFTDDLATLQTVKNKFPNYNYIAVGHSLGSAIIDRFLRAGLIRNALSYNPAVEPQELRGNPLHRRIYNEDDPLYKIEGYLIPGIEVRRGSNTFWATLARHGIPGGKFIGVFSNTISNLVLSLNAHGLGSFIGGISRYLYKK